MQRWSVLMLLMAGCMAGPNVETLIDDLRVVGLVLEPPEASPGDVVELEITIADPAEGGAELLFWTCTDLSFSGDCLESSAGVPWGVSVPFEAGVGRTQWAVPPSTQFLFDKGASRFPLEFRVMACEEGLCPLIEQTLAGDAEALEGLADPSDGLRDLPFEGVSYATRFGWLSGQPVDAHNKNPIVAPTFDEAGLVQRKQGVDLLFSVEDEQDVLVYGYAEQGGFERPETPVRDGEVTVTWFPPEGGAKGDVKVYVAFEDGDGGSALWTGVLAPNI